MGGSPNTNDRNVNKMRRKGNWNEMMQESEIENAEDLDEGSSKKRRKMNANGTKKNDDLNDIDMKDRIEDVDAHKAAQKKKDKMTLSRMFEEQNEKKNNKKEMKPKLVCPIC